MDTGHLAEQLQVLTNYGASVVDSLAGIRGQATMPSKKHPADPTSVPTGMVPIKFFYDSSCLAVARSLAKKFPEAEPATKVLPSIHCQDLPRHII
jgi:hypothetical protein